MRTGTPLQVYLTGEMRSELEALAGSLGWSLSRVAVEAIREYLARPPQIVRAHENAPGRARPGGAAAGRSRRGGG